MYGNRDQTQSSTEPPLLPRVAINLQLQSPLSVLGLQSCPDFIAGFKIACLLFRWVSMYML